MTQAQRTLNNRYELQAKIGDGGMAVVYRALDTQLNRMVAIKILRDTYASDPAFLQRFRREAQAAASLTHPHIVNVYDVGQDGDLYYIVMEYIDGTNLKEVINREAPLGTAQALEIGAQICDAIGYAHSHNLIHRDVKPQNVLIDRKGRVKVTDFGIAKSQGDATLTQTGVTLGTVHYFSPEQARGLAAMPQSDIYSIGVVVYEMLSGRIPFESDNPVALAIKHIDETPPPIRRFNPNVPPDVEQAVMRALNKEPARRYATAEAFAQVLRGFESQANDSTMAVPRNPRPRPNPNGGRPITDPNNSDNIYTQANPPRVAPPIAQPHPNYNQVQPQNYAPGYTEYDDYNNAPARRPSQPYPPQRQAQQTYSRVPTRGEPAYVEEYEERRGPGCGAWVLGLSALGILLAIVLFGVFVLVPQLSQPAPTATPAPTAGPTATIASVGKTNVPNIVGKSQQDAENTLKAAKLVLGETKQDFKDNVPAGQVISQDPPASKPVDQQSKVNIVVSKGKDLVGLPSSYTNTDPNAAKQQLENLGFKVEVINEPSDSIQAGAVTRTDPTGGQNVQIARGSNVKLYVSSGPLPTATPLPTNTPVPPPPATNTPVPQPTPTKPTRKVLVPTNLIGLDQAAATQALAQAGFKVNIVQWNEDDIKRIFPNDPNALNTYRNLKVGQVLGSDPRGGTTVDEGTTITISVKK